MSDCHTIPGQSLAFPSPGTEVASRDSLPASLPWPDPHQFAVQEVQNRVLHLIATNVPLSHVLTTLAQGIEALSRQALCAIFLLEDNGTTLRPLAMPSLPDETQRLFSLGIPLIPHCVTCGSAVTWKGQIGIERVATNSWWSSCSHFIWPHALQTSWSRPIFNSHQEVTGALVLFHDTPCQPSEQDQQLMQLSTSLAGIAIERQQAEQKLQALNARLEQQIQRHKAQLQQAISFEATLKRITDRVRDSLDESHILQTTVKELGQIPGVYCCDAGIYSSDRTTSTIAYECKQPEIPSGIGRVIQLSQFPDIYTHLSQGEHLQFALLETPSPRHKAKQFTILACPILDDSSVLGDLWLLKHRNDTFDEQEVKLVQQVANQCAIALRQARLYQSSQAQVRELARVNHLKDDFLSTVSHELRTPIANMKMAIKLLSLARSDEQRDRYLKILHQECQRESDLINDLLDLQQLEASCDRRTLTDQLELAAWVPTLIEPFTARTQERQQIFAVQVNSDLPAVWLTHRNSLERILSELLNNACKYTPKGGHIELAVTRHPETGGIQFQVRNEACIAEVELPNLFKKFYRIPNADPWKQGGTGLGLALIEKLVEQLRGTLKVVSQDGWTTFSVEFST